MKALLLVTLIIYILPFSSVGQKEELSTIKPISVKTDQNFQRIEYNPQVHLKKGIYDVSLKSENVDNGVQVMDLQALELEPVSAVQKINADIEKAIKSRASTEWLAKAGYKDRIIALNSWIYPEVTPWQEYWAGEVASPVALPVNGHMVDRPVPDLRYQALLIMEPYWVQQQQDHSDPRFKASELSQYIRDCMNNRGAVTINMGIYQNGTVGEKALNVMKQVCKIVRGSESNDGKAGK